MCPVTYPTETTQQVNRTNHVNPPIKAEQPKLVNDLNQHQAERHVAWDPYSPQRLNKLYGGDRVGRG
jgi:hypothetical protein